MQLEPIAPIIKTAVALLVVVNPIGAVPMFLGLTHGDGEAHRPAMARTAAIATVLILLVAAIAGRMVLDFFGISIPSFQVAGGVLFLLMGLDMLNARPSRSRETPEETEEASRRKEIAVVPIAMPQLAGPGAIGSVILFADQGPFWPHGIAVLTVVLIVGIFSYVALRLSSVIARGLGATGINILSRVEGLLLVAVAVEVMVKGMKMLWKG